MAVSAPRRAARRLGILLTFGAGVGIVAATLAWALPGPWYLDLFGHFRAHYALALTLAAGLLGLGRAWRWLAAALALLGIGGAPLVPLWSASPSAAAGASLRVVHFNVLSQNHAYAAVEAWLGGTGADLVFVQEVSPRWAAALGAMPGYRTLAMVPRADNFGIAALAREGLRVRASEVVALAEELPAIRVDLDHEGRQLSFLSVHTLPPVSGPYAQVRDQQIAAAGGWAAARRGEGAAPVVIGDLNATPWSAPLRAMVADAGLVDSQRGHGLQASWPTGGGLHGLLRIPIDHCLHDPALVTRARSLGPELGSDHRPVVVELAWAAGGDGRGRSR